MRKNRFTYVFTVALLCLFFVSGCELFGTSIIPEPYDFTRLKDVYIEGDELVAYIEKEFGTATVRGYHDNSFKPYRFELHRASYRKDTLELIRSEKVYTRKLDILRIWSFGSRNLAISGKTGIECLPEGGVCQSFAQACSSAGYRIMSTEHFVICDNDVYRIVGHQLIKLSSVDPEFWKGDEEADRRNGRFVSGEHALVTRTKYARSLGFDLGGGKASFEVKVLKYGVELVDQTTMEFDACQSTLVKRGAVYNNGVFSLVVDCLHNDTAYLISKTGDGPVARRVQARMPDGVSYLLKYDEQSQKLFLAYLERDELHVAAFPAN